MTDDTENHEAAEVHAGEDLDHHEAGGDHWQEGQSVDDGFGDEPAAATVSGEEGTGEEDAPPESVQPTPRRNKMLPVIIGLGALIVLGGLLYMQFGSLLHRAGGDAAPTHVAANPPKTPHIQNETTPKTGFSTMANNTPSVPPAQAPGQQTGVAMPVEQPAAAPPAQHAPATGISTVIPPAPVSPSAPSTPPVAAVPAPAPAANPATTLATASAPAPAPSGGSLSASTGLASAPLTMKSPPAAQMPHIEPMPVSGTPSVASAPLLSPPGTVSAPANPATAPGGASGDQHIVSLNTRIDGLEKSLGQLSDKLGQLGDRIQTLQQTSTMSASFDERLGKIEQKLADGYSADAAVPRAERTHKTSVARHTAARHHKAAGTSSRRHRAKAETARWVLRAAMTDQAWIARDDMTSELRAVHVGDAVPGIGKVTAIREGDSGWEILGTKGTVQ